MKTFSIILFAFFIFIIVDACKVRNEEWTAHIYVNNEYVGTCEIVMNGNNGYKGEILRDTVELNGGLQYEEMILVRRIK